MSSAQYIPGMEEGHRSIPELGEPPVEPATPAEAEDWLEVAARAQAVLEDEARKLVREAHDEIERKKHGEQSS